MMILTLTKKIFDVSSPQRLVLHSTTSGLTSDLGTLLDSLTALQITPS